MFLSKEEIIDLTGCKQGHKQIKWLSQHAYKFEVSAIGKPIVLKSHIEERLSGLSSKFKASQEPDFSSFGLR